LRPYHQWRYAIDGALEHTPHAGGFRVHHAPEAPHDQLGLTPVRSECWNGFVFVDMSGTAVDFDEHIRPTADRLAPVDFTLFRHDREIDGSYTVHANCKTIVEHFVESYHVPQVHPELQTTERLCLFFYGDDAIPAEAGGDQPARTADDRRTVATAPRRLRRPLDAASERRLP